MAEAGKVHGNPGSENSARPGSAAMPIAGDGPHAAARYSRACCNPNDGPPWKRPALSPEREQVTGKDTEVEKRAHGCGEQHQVEGVCGWRDHRGQGEDRQDGVPAVPDKKAGRDQSEAGQQKDHDRQFEQDSDPKHHIDEALEIDVHGNHGDDKVPPWRY